MAHISQEFTLRLIGGFRRGGGLLELCLYIRAFYNFFRQLRVGTGKFLSAFSHPHLELCRILCFSFED